MDKAKNADKIFIRRTKQSPQTKAKTMSISDQIKIAATRKWLQRTLPARRAAERSEHFRVTRACLKIQKQRCPERRAVWATKLWNAIDCTCSPSELWAIMRLLLPDHWEGMRFDFTYWEAGE